MNTRSLVFANLILIIAVMPTISQNVKCVATEKDCKTINKCCELGDNCYNGKCRTCSFWSCTTEKDCCFDGDYCYEGLCQWCVLSGQSCTPNERGSCCVEEEECVRGVCAKPSTEGQVCNFNEQCKQRGKILVCDQGFCKSCIPLDSECSTESKCCSLEETCLNGFCRNCCQRGDSCLFKITCCNPQDIWHWETYGRKSCVESHSVNKHL